MGKDTRPLWQQMGRKSEDDEQEMEQPAQTSSRWGEWFKKRIIGEKTAGTTAAEEIEKAKKKQGY
jgi:hypothetical protein